MKKFEAVIVDGKVDISDGYHTFTELYEHRCLLFACLISTLVNEGFKQAWKSKQHSDGTEFDGWFIAGLDLPTGTVTYHLPNNLWDLVYAPERNQAPVWDGHTSPDVIERLTNWLK